MFGMRPISAVGQLAALSVACSTKGRHDDGCSATKATLQGRSRHSLHAIINMARSYALVDSDDAKYATKRYASERNPCSLSHTHTSTRLVSFIFIVQ
jgi:hypothetical protein